MTVSGDEPEVLCNKLKVDAGESATVNHGDEWQFGELKFLAHIHHGIKVDFMIKFS